VSAHYRVKQVILVRRDLKNAKGKPVHPPKMMAQVAHGAMAWLGSRFKAAPRDGEGRFIIELNEAERTWLVDGDYAKIVLGVDNQEEMEGIVTQAVYLGVTVEEILDAGHTEFDGTPTVTCVALGPSAPTSWTLSLEA
jgi:PTH2 family peptidyl-tRNA hydrolase